MESQEKSKYFTPDIEDIRVGYEVESHEWSMDEAGVPELNYDRWVDKKLTASHVATIMTYGVRKGDIRVPYLTKEQIPDLPENISILIDIISHKIQIIDNNTSDKIVFYGECKDINTFRYICKLLKIN